jgi:antitoxin FitA
LTVEVGWVAAVSIRNLDDGVPERLRERAAEHGHSMEAEIRAILTDAVRPATASTGLAQALVARIGELSGVELELPARIQAPRTARLPD